MYPPPHSLPPQADGKTGISELTERKKVTRLAPLTQFCIEAMGEARSHARLAASGSSPRVEGQAGRARHSPLSEFHYAGLQTGGGEKCRGAGQRLKCERGSSLWSAWEWEETLYCFRGEKEHCLMWKSESGPQSLGAGGACPPTHVQEGLGSVLPTSEWSFSGQTRPSVWVFTATRGWTRVPGSPRKYWFHGRTVGGGAGSMNPN